MLTVLASVIQRRASVARSWARVALGLWFGSMLLLGAGLLAKHVLALPAPIKNERLSHSLTELRRPGTVGWLAVHVLYAECRCSQRIASHLVSSQRPKGWQELVLWVGEVAPDPAFARAFDVRQVSQGQLAGLGIESAPLLVAMDPEGRLSYVGGYTDRKQGPDIRDLRILVEAEKGSMVPTLPIFGCAVSERLQRSLAALPGP